MVSTHALRLAEVPSSHWLFSDLWLPNGWATVVFVVLSGYGVGYIFSARHPSPTRYFKLHRRVGVILLVMLLSNTVFAIFRLMIAGDVSTLWTFEWWLGFVTLETQWTISGVLLPTALVMLCGPRMIRWTQAAPWDALLILVLARLGVSLFAVLLQSSPEGAHWLARFLLFEGLGFFPILPFVLNGCIGIWLGVQRHRSENLWFGYIATLLLLQVATYLSTFMLPGLVWTVWRSSFGPIGKFGWMFLCASILSHMGPRLMTDAFALVGKFALSAFVLHRVFLHMFNAVLSTVDLGYYSVDLYYVVLCGCTLFTTWGGCLLHKRWKDRESVQQRSAPILVADGYLML